jgi:hypothetical protein
MIAFIALSGIASWTAPPPAVFASQGETRYSGLLPGPTPKHNNLNNGMRLVWAPLEQGPSRSENALRITSVRLMPNKDTLD